MAARGLERRTTWYLASDQFAFLTFAEDLAHGRVFHDDTTIRWLSARESSPPGAADAYYLTYIWRDGRLYSRYPPGYPLLLMVAGALGGEIGRHALNPLLYLVLLCLLGVLAKGLVRPAVPAAAGACGVGLMWLLLVLPTAVHQWGITIARDLPTHLLALAAVLAALRGRLAAAGLALGFAASIRPDAILWGVALASVTLCKPRPSMRAVLAGSAAFLTGAAPLFAYNMVTQGHPLAFSQGSEFRSLFVTASSAFALLDVQALPGISGGGFRFANIPSTLPDHLRYLGGAFGVLAVPALGALLWALRRRRPMAAAFGAYIPVGVLFYSCWGRADPRYLVGVVLCLLALAATGLVLTTGWMADPARPRGRRLLAATLAVPFAFAGPYLTQRAQPDRVAPVERSLGGAMGLVAIASALPGLPPHVVRVAPLVPALVLAALGVTRVMTGSGARDPVQRADVARARSTLEALLPAGALVLTTPALGRPAENITWYTGAEAHYLGELRSLASTPARTAGFFLDRGRRVFLLLDAKARPPDGLTLHEVAFRQGETLLEWFVDPNRAAAGAVLSEVVATSR